jgi:DNA polymerase III subunit delta
LTKPGGVAAILGADTYLAEAALERLLADRAPKDRDESVEVFRGDETTWDRLLGAARMRSLFAEERALVVRGAEGLKGDGEGVLAYLGDPTPGVTLILLAAKPDKRKTVWKRIAEGAVVITAEPLRGTRLRSYVEDELRRRRLRISPEALGELIDRVGGDLRRLMGEADKLLAFAEGGEVSAEDVARVCGRGLGRPLYVLADAFGQRDVGSALEEVEAALEDGERPELVLSALHRSLRQVRGVRQMAEERRPREEMVRRLGLPPNMGFKVPALVESARRWTDQELKTALEALGRADQAIKKGVSGGATLAAAIAAARRPDRRPIRPGSPRAR